MLLKIFVFSFSLTLTLSTSVRTVNKVESTVKQDPPEKEDGYESSNPWDDVCSSRNTARNRHQQEEPPRQAGINFYLKRNDPAVNDLNILNAFGDILTLPERIGVHDVTVEPNNLTVQELEAALNDAWAPNLVPPTNSNNYSANPPSIRIVSLLDSGQELTANGSAITRIVYTIVFPNASSLWTSSSHSDVPKPLKLRRIPPPTKEQFTLRLAANGLIVYTGELFPSQSIFIKTRPSDLDPTEIKRRIVADYERNSADRSCIGSSDLDIRIADSWQSIAVREARFKRLYSINCVIFAKNQTIQWQSDPEESNPEVRRAPNGDESSVDGAESFSASYYNSGWGERSRPIKRSSPPHNPALSFRMYSSAPINLQLLPELERVMTQSFNEKLGYYSSGRDIEVFIWNPDVDHATTIEFFISLKHGGKHVDLDARLLYAEDIYRHLNKSTMTSSSDKTFSIRLGQQPITNGTDTGPQVPQECGNGSLLTEAQSYGDCQFSLQYLTEEPQSPGQLPPTEQIIQHVTSVFSERNQLTFDSAYFNITFVNQQVLFRTLKGHVAFELRFSFSFSQLTSGKFWNVWRLPFTAVHDKIRFDDETRSFFPLHPNLSFRLYTSVPISIQYSQRFADFLKDQIELYYLASLVAWNPDINGTGCFDFFALGSGVYGGERIIDPKSQSGQRIYDSLTKEGRRFKFVENSVNNELWGITADLSGSSSRIYGLYDAPSSDNYVYGRYESGNALTGSLYVGSESGYGSRYASTNEGNGGITLSRQWFSDDGPARGSNNTMVSCADQSSDILIPCLLPRTFALLIKRVQQQYWQPVLGTGDLLRAVGNAFVEANPAVIDNVGLNVTLTNRTDDFQTLKGDWVTELEFTLTYPEMESGKFSKLWKYPKEEVLKRYLATVSANLVTEPIY